MNNSPETPLSASSLSEAQTAVLYANLRAYTQHEDILVGQRFTWLITAQGFLFTAYGLTVQQLAKALESTFHHGPSVLLGLDARTMVYLIFGLLIICVSISFNRIVGASIKSANMTLVGLEKIWEAQYLLHYAGKHDGLLSHRPDNHDFRFLSPIFGVFPYIQGGGYRLVKALGKNSIGLPWQGRSVVSGATPEVGKDQLQRKEHADLPNTLIVTWIGILIMHIIFLFLLSALSGRQSESFSPSDWTIVVA